MYDNYVYLLSYSLHRWDLNDTDLLNRCSFVDPRTKCLAHLTPSDRDKVRDQILTAIKVDKEFSMDTDSVECVDSTPAATPESGLLSTLLPTFHTESSTVTSAAEKEMERYLSEASIPMESDPLEW